MYGEIRETTGRPPPASSPHRPDPAGVSTSAECLSTGLSATLSRKPNRRGATPSARRGWWLQGALAAARRPTLVYPGYLISALLPFSPGICRLAVVAGLRGRGSH